MSEFVAAIVGAILGSLSSGFISWILQRSAFALQRQERLDEKRAADRAQLLQALYAAMVSASDLHKFADVVDEALGRAATMPPLAVEGLSNTWLALFPLTSLPEPATIDPAAITVLIDYDAHDLAMKTLDAAARHDGAIKRWSVYGDSRRRFGEKAPVEIREEGTFTMMRPEDVNRHYPHLKELSDYADAICDEARKHANDALALVDQLAAFITANTGKPIKVAFADDAKPADEPDEGK